MLQTSVEMVKPGGTGRPALVISAKPEPLPPSRSFMFRLPSALPDPKKKTCFLLIGFFPVAFFDIHYSLLLHCRRERAGHIAWHDLGDVRNRRHEVPQAC